MEAVAKRITELLDNAKSCYSKGLLSQAQEGFETAIASGGDPVLCHRYLARIANLQKNWELASQHWTWLRNSLPNDVEPLLQLARISRRFGELAQAECGYKEVLRRDPEQSEAIRALKEIEATLSKPSFKIARRQAAEYAQSAAASPQLYLKAYTEACVKHVERLYKEGEFEACLRTVASLIRQEQSVGAHFRFAILSAGKLHNFQRGHQIAQEALSRLDRTEQGFYWKVRCASAAGDYSITNRLLSEGMKPFSKTVPYWAAFAEFLWQRGDVAGALAASARAQGLGSLSGGLERLTKRWRRIADVLGMPDANLVRGNEWFENRLEDPGEHYAAAILRLLMVRPRIEWTRPDRNSLFERPKKIAIVGMHLGFGGAPQKAIRLAKELAADSRRIVFYLCPEHKNESFHTEVAALEAAGVSTKIYDGQDESEIIEIAPRQRLLLELLDPLRRRRRIVRLAAVLQVREIDTVHGIGTNELQLEVGVAAAIANTRRSILNLGMMRPESYSKKDVSRDEARVYQSFLREAVKYPQYSLANNSLRAAQDYSDWLGITAPPLAILRNGVNLPERVPQLACRARLGISQTAKVILVVGRIAHEKRPDLVLSTFDLVRDVVPEALLLFLGDGPLAEFVRKEVHRERKSAQIRIDGFVRDPTPYYQSADILLMVSEAEGLPNVVLEAQAAGLPVVATDAGGTREALVNGKSGYIVSSLDPKALAQYCARILTDSHLKDEMAQHANTHIVQHYTMAHMAASADLLYRTGHIGVEKLRILDGQKWGTECDDGQLPSRAISLARTGGLSPARQLLREALRQRPGSIRIWEALLRIEIWSGRLQRTKLLYSRIADDVFRRGALSRSDYEEIYARLDMEARQETTPGAVRISRAISQHNWTWLNDHSEKVQASELGAKTLEFRRRLEEASCPTRDLESPLASLLRKYGQRSKPHRRARNTNRVCLWIGTLGLGGGERQMSLLESALRCAGKEVALLVDEHAGISLPSSKDVFALSEWQSPSVADERSNFQKQLEAFANYYGQKGAGRLPQLISFFRNYRPEAVHLRGVAENATATAAAAVLTGVPRVVINVGTMLHSRQSDGSFEAAAAYKQNISVLKLISRRDSVRFAFNSEAASQDWSTALGLRAGQAVVIHNAFSSAYLEGKLTPEQMSRLNRIREMKASGTRIVVGVFRFHHVKMPLRWIKTAFDVIETGTDAHFVLCGGGNLVAEAQCLVATRGHWKSFSFFGNISDGLASIYREADVLLHTSKTESAPNAIIEAQAFGCRIVAPNVGGVKEVLAPTEMNFLVERPGVCGFSQSLLQALSFPPRDGMGRAFVEERFSTERMLTEFLNLYSC